MTTTTITAGDRFVSDIKRRIGEHTKNDPSADLTATMEMLRRAKAEAFRQFLKLPKSAEVEAADDRDTCVVNGVPVEIQYSRSRDEWRLVQDGATKQAKAEVDRLSKSKAEWCKAQAELVSAMNTAGINAFKAYVRAKHDKLAVVEAMSDRDFRGLVAEFLAGRAAHTCPL